jgi:3'(2'), 5'-bisphosphate nucleotidase
MTPYTQEVELARRLAREAGAIALKHRAAGVTAVEKPGGEGPVTAADRECDAHIRAALGAAFPSDGLLTEETPDDGAWRTVARVWMVDPLDGTKDYVQGGEEFAAMVGLCVDGLPVVGAVYRPLGDLLYWAAQGHGAFLEHAGVTTRLQCARGVPAKPVVAVSKNHPSRKLDTLLAALGPLTALPSGSVGLKIGLIAQGKASAYLNGSSKTCLWDSCAPQAILLEAGGVITDLYGTPITYAAGLNHPNGLFCATVDVHTALKDNVAATARRVMSGGMA